MSLLISDSTSSLKPLSNSRLISFCHCCLVGEPGIVGDLLGPLAVGVAQRDLHAVRQFALLEILRAQAEELRLGDRHPLRLVGQVDRALLDDAVDVVSPRIVIQQAIDGQLQLVVQAVQEPPHAARRLAAAVRQNALVLAPELVLVEPLPDRVFFDVQDELGRACV